MASHGTNHVSSSPCVKRSCVKGETERTTVHQTHPRYGRTFSSVRWKDTSHLLLFLLLLCLTVQLSAGSQEDGCKRRKNKKFPKCVCGEYALVIPNEEVQEWHDAEAMVHTVERGSKQRYYVCSQCSKCGDGILVTKPCSQRSDTECSPDRCADSTWVFDFGLKACKPSPARALTTTPRAPTTTLSWPLAHGETPSARADVPDENADAPAFGTRSWLEKHMTDIIIGIIGGVAVLVVCIFIMLAMVVRMCRRIPSAPKSPFSSHNTSQSSVADV